MGASARTSRRKADVVAAAMAAEEAIGDQFNLVRFSIDGLRGEVLAHRRDIQGLQTRLKRCEIEHDALAITRSELAQYDRMGTLARWRWLLFGRSLFVVCALAWASVASAEPTCTFPWTENHWQTHYHDLFEPGQYYRAPYNEVVEILARVCLVWDETIDDDTGAVVARTCGQEVFAGRHVVGRKGTPFKVAVYLDTTTGLLVYPDFYLPVTRAIGSWAKLPEGCYPPSVAVSVQGGGVQVNAR